MYGARPVFLGSTGSQQNIANDCSFPIIFSLFLYLLYKKISSFIVVQQETCYSSYLIYFLLLTTVNSLFV